MKRKSRIPTRPRDVNPRDLRRKIKTRYYNKDSKDEKLREAAKRPGQLRNVFINELELRQQFMKGKSTKTVQQPELQTEKMSKSRSVAGQTLDMPPVKHGPG